MRFIDVIALYGAWAFSSIALMVATTFTLPTFAASDAAYRRHNILTALLLGWVFIGGAVLLVLLWGST